MTQALYLVVTFASVASEGSDGARPDDAPEESRALVPGAEDVPFVIKNVQRGQRHVILRSTSAAGSLRS